MIKILAKPLHTAVLLPKEKLIIFPHTLSVVNALHASTKKKEKPNN
jgi:hypothetical protein